MKKLVLFMNSLLVARAPSGQDLSTIISTHLWVRLRSRRNVDLHVALFPCLVDLISVSADNVEVSY